jgi:hypothetical protein
VLKSRSQLPLEIAAVTRTNLISALESVRGCIKTTSMLWMQALGLRVLSGVVLSDWSRSSEKAVRRYARTRHFSSLLLRIDKRHERWTRRRGGYLVSLTEIPATVKELRREGMITVLLEPASPYTDQYGLAAVTAPDQGKLFIEVVGPGFDASDILRNDVMPHERWEADLGLPNPRGKTRPTISCRRIHLVSSEHYRATVERRLAKIGARARNPAFPDTVLGGRTESSLLAKEGIAFLKRMHQTMLLRHSNSYSAIPEKHINSLAQSIHLLLRGLSGYGIHLGPSSFAASIIPRRGLVFWDFFPSRKQEQVSLYPAEKNLASIAPL